MFPSFHGLLWNGIEHGVISWLVGPAIISCSYKPWSEKVVEQSERIHTKIGKVCFCLVENIIGAAGFDILLMAIQ